MEKEEREVQESKNKDWCGDSFSRQEFKNHIVSWVGTSKNSHEFQSLLGLSFWILAKVKSKGILKFVHPKKKGEKLR